MGLLRQLTRAGRYFRHTFLFFLLVGVVLCAAVSVRAQESGLLPGELLGDNPKDRPVTITASVPVQEPPPAPILIQPEDEELLNSGFVTFKWRVQPHLINYSRQELFLNGELYFPNISMNANQTDEYTLSVQDSVYTLVLRSGHNLSDGDYTWRVQVLDVNNRSTSSTTWFFTIDSSAPQLVITQIEEYETAISSLDATTVPDEPFMVATKIPEVHGKTEAGATVEMVVVFPNGVTNRQTVQADASGNFSFTVPALTRGEKVELRFTAIDAAENTSALSNIFVVYQPAVFSFPLLPPFLLPDVPVVEIPLDLPVIAIPNIVIPEEVQDIIQGPLDTITTVTKITTKYDSMLLLYLPWVTAALFALYLLTLFLLTGSHFFFFPRFVWSFLRAWFLGWKRQPHQWRDELSRLPIPAFAFEVQRSAAKGEKIRKQQHLTSIFGEWETTVLPRWVHSLAVRARNWKYPRSGRFSEVWSEVRELWLYGESFTWESASPEGERDRVWSTSSECFVIPAGMKQYRFVAWAAHERFALPVELRFLPRSVLMLSVALAAVIVLLSPGFWSLVWFIFVLWVCFRDLSWQLPELWKVHFQLSRGRVS